MGPRAGFDASTHRVTLKQLARMAGARLLHAHAGIGPRPHGRDGNRYGGNSVLPPAAPRPHGLDARSQAATELPRLRPRPHGRDVRPLQK